MISKEDREAAVDLLNEVALGTVAIIEFTDGRLFPIQKWIMNRWLSIGTTEGSTTEDIMEPVNIEKVTVYYEHLEGKD